MYCWEGFVINKFFKGDNNKNLRNLQESVYDKNVSMVFWKVREEYIKAIRITGVQTELYEIIYEVKSIDYRILDHRIFQITYDIIAANFRYKNPNIEQMKLPFQKHAKMDIKKAHKKEKLTKWNNFFKKEINNLIKYPEFIRSILRCVASYENTENEKMEKNLCDYLSFLRFLYIRYSDSFWGKCYLEDTVLVNIKEDYY